MKDPLVSAAMAPRLIPPMSHRISATIASEIVIGNAAPISLLTVWAYRTE